MNPNTRRAALILITLIIGANFAAGCAPKGQVVDQAAKNKTLDPSEQRDRAENHGQK